MEEGAGGRGRTQGEDGERGKGEREDTRKRWGRGGTNYEGLEAEFLSLGHKEKMGKEGRGRGRTQGEGGERGKGEGGPTMKVLRQSSCLWASVGELPNPDQTFWRTGDERLQ